eukprot:1138547-Pelagomonas_calceolata.AAC.15
MPLPPSGQHPGHLLTHKSPPGVQPPSAERFGAAGPYTPSHADAPAAPAGDSRHVCSPTSPSTAAHTLNSYIRHSLLWSEHAGGGGGAALVVVALGRAPAAAAAAAAS